LQRLATANSLQRDAFDSELRAARAFLRERRHDDAFAHLERAHVLGQAFVGPHVTAHWLMLVVALRRRESRAAFGQVLRILLCTLGSAIGSVPTGNTGGSNVSMFRRMPIDPALAAIMRGEK
jgi:hypothetical protein